MKSFLSHLQTKPVIFRVLLAGVLTSVLWVLLRLAFAEVGAYSGAFSVIGYLLTLMLPVVVMKLLQRDLPLASIAASSLSAFALAGLVLRSRSLEMVGAWPASELLFDIVFTGFFLLGLAIIAKAAKLQQA